MKHVIIILLCLFSVGCSRQDKVTNQNHVIDGVYSIAPINRVELMADSVFITYNAPEKYGKFRIVNLGGTIQILDKMENPKNSSWDGNIMAESAGKGVVSKKNINTMLIPAITRHSIINSILNKQNIILIHEIENRYNNEKNNIYIYNYAIAI